MQRVIIWDLDGTLLDSMGIFEAVMARIVPGYGLAVPSHDVVLRNFHGSLEETISGVLGGVAPDVLQSIVREFLAHQDNEYEIVEPHILLDARRLAERAHTAGYRQIVVTNREHTARLRASPRHIVANSSLSQFIDLIICGDDSAHRKPKPLVLGDMLQEIKASDVLVVGDQHVDAEFAQNLGTPAVLVCRDGGEPPHMANLPNWQDTVQIVRSLDEVVLTA